MSSRSLIPSWVETFEDLQSASTAEELWAVLIRWHGMRASSVWEEPYLLFMRFHRHDSTDADMTAALLCTDHRWRNAAHHLIARLTDSGVLDGEQLDVIVLQAGAARLADDSDQALDAVTQIERVGRDALVDLDHLLGLLQHPGDEPARAPSRTVHDIVTLVDELRGAGADIRLDNRCDCELNWRTAAVAYRITQESLTNALKHAGDARIVVTLSCTATEFHLAIVDDGAGTHATRTPHGGRGIPGMIERANVLGGHLTAHAQPGTGFAVDAVLPKTPVDTSTPSRVTRPRAATP